MDVYARYLISRQMAVIAFSANVFATRAPTRGEVDLCQCMAAPRGYEWERFMLLPINTRDQLAGRAEPELHGSLLDRLVLVKDLGGDCANRMVLADVALQNRRSFSMQCWVERHQWQFRGEWCGPVRDTFICFEH